MKRFLILLCFCFSLPANPSDLQSGFVDGVKITPSSGTNEPLLYNRPLPPYSPAALAAKAEGHLILEVVFLKDGTFGDIKVIQSLGFGIDELAIETIRKDWKFDPAVINGVPADVKATVDFRYKLSVPRESAGKTGSTGDRGSSTSPYMPGTRGLVLPEVIYRPLPPYTDRARKAKAEGTIVLQAIIRSDGTVTGCKIVKGLGFGLDESAIDTITQKWQFRPGTLDGQPVDVKANIEVTFRLSKKFPETGKPGR